MSNSLWLGDEYKRQLLWGCDNELLSLPIIQRKLTGQNKNISLFVFCPQGGFHCFCYFLRHQCRNDLIVGIFTYLGNIHSYVSYHHIFITFAVGKMLQKIHSIPQTSIRDNIHLHVCIHYIGTLDIQTAL